MPKTVPSTESRDIAEWTPLEDQEVEHNDGEEHVQTQKWKGKSKDLDFQGIDTEMAVTQDGGMPTFDEREEEGGVGRSYPPMSEEAAEEREVAENLKRWETAERLRRKALRESRSTSGGSIAPTVVTSLGRRASQLLFRRSTSSSRDSKSMLRVGSPTPLNDVEQQMNSLARTETADTMRNPFRDPAAASSNAALMSPTSADPFQTSTKEHRRTDSTSTVTGGATEPVQPTPQRPILQASGSSSFFTEEPENIRVPPPRPLDIPTTPAPQHVYEGGGRILARMSGPQEGMRVRRTVVEIEEEQEELERERNEGRWWTDWLCGLKERRDPGGQGGRTNPFE